MLSIRKKFVLGLVIAVTLISMIPQTTYASLKYSKPSSWARRDVDGAKVAGLIPGEINGDYKEDITREEFSELAVKLYETLSRKNVTVQQSNPFTDTANSNAIIADQLGIMGARNGKNFAPKEKITREEVSVVLYNTLKTAKPRYNYDVSYECEFKDSHMISNQAAKKAIGYLYGTEIVNGVDENYFNPKGYTSREESIILVKKMYDKVVESERTSRGQLPISRVPVSKQESKQEGRLRELISKEMGKPYKYGSAGPNSYDCSGLTYSLFGRLGIKIGRTSRSQINSGVPVAKKDLKFGDIVLFARDGKNINHVGIYMGDGKFVHSPQTGDVVKETTLASGYYSRCYYAARRVLQ